MVLTSSGEILTNNHVIRGATDDQGPGAEHGAELLRPRSSAMTSRMTLPSCRRAAPRI